MNAELRHPRWLDRAALMAEGALMADGASAAGDRWTAEGDGVAHPAWYALVSSRLGRSVERRREWFELLMRGALRARNDGAALLVVDRTAAAPWVERAAKLLAVPLVRVRTPPGDRDAALISLADRVFALWVRDGGTVQRLLHQRLVRSPGDAVWTAVTRHPQCGGAPLVRSGAVGWILPARPRDRDATSAVGGAPAVPIESLPIEPLPIESLPIESLPSEAVPVDAVPWDEFLVHCTRARDGPLPGQSPDQWRDEVLLGGDDGHPASAADMLVRILASGWIWGGDRLTRGRQPVVCWADVPLPQLLGRRTFRAHLGRWDYEPFGVAVRRQAVRRRGGMPVHYGTGGDARCLPADQQWRFQPIGRRIDWTAEREWRLPGGLDLGSLTRQEAVVFVGDWSAARRVAPLSRWPLVVWSCRSGRISSDRL